MNPTAFLTGVLRRFGSILGRSAASALAGVLFLGALPALSAGVTFSVSSATPGSGTTGGSFSISGNVGVALAVTFDVTGLPAPAKSWKINGSLPNGLTVSGGNPLNVSGSTAMTVSGTPTAAGLFSVDVVVWDGANASGNAHGITCTFRITQNPSGSAPVFTTHPLSASVVQGESVILRATATGTPAPTLQWYLGDATIAGATGALLQLNSVTSANGGSYKVVATNSTGTATSNVAVLTVIGAGKPVELLASPLSVTALAGANVSYRVIADGVAPITYQWRKDGTDITGETSSKLTLTNVSSSNAGTYTVVATNAAGSIISGAATFAIDTAAVAPAISTDPSGRTVPAGARLILTFAHTGTYPVTYQWSKNGTAITGANDAAYIVPVTSAADAGSYTVTVSNASGAATSNPAVVTVSNLKLTPDLNSQPQSTTVALHDTAQARVSVGGVQPLRLQWRRNGFILAGQTATTLTLADAQVADAGTYTVTLSNDFGSVTSQAITVTVDASVTIPRIAVQTADPTVANGHNISLSLANASSFDAFEWQVSADNGATWAFVGGGGLYYSGGTTSTFTISGANAAIAGHLYRVIGTYKGGWVISNAVSLSIITPALPGPSGVVLDSSGDAVVADSLNNTLQRVTSAGVASLVAGNSGTQGSADGSGASASFRQPGAIARDASGNYFVADTGNSLIRKVTSSGTVSTFAGSAANQGHKDGNGTSAWFNTPAGLVVDSSGNVYVADTGNAVIRKITSGGDVTTLAGSPGVRGNVDGTGSAARFYQPTGITLDGSGNLYVSDSGNQTIRKVTSGGVVTTLAGLAGVSGSTDGFGPAALFNQPGGLTVDSSGKLYVADTGNSTIRVVTSGGDVSTLAGLPTVAGLKDGSNLEAWFSQPKDLKLDSSGNLIVADYGNATLRKVSSSGAVTAMKIAAASSGSSSSSSSGSSGSSSSSSSSSSSGGGALGAGLPLLLAAAWVGAHLLGRHRAA